MMYPETIYIKYHKILDEKEKSINKHQLFIGGPDIAISFVILLKSKT